MTARERFLSIVLYNLYMFVKKLNDNLNMYILTYVFSSLDVVLSFFTCPFLLIEGGRMHDVIKDYSLRDDN